MESTSSMIGLLVMAYGGPDNLDEVEPYLMDVRGYRDTAPEIVHEVRERYREIGGRSPILERTQAQADAIQSALDPHGHDFKVFVGMRHWHPFIQDTLAEMRAQGIERMVGLVMAPHYSRMSIQAYFKKIDDADPGMQVARIHDWHLLPEYLDALADRVRAALERFPESVRADVPVIFTAHSLPQRILEWGDPYPMQLLATTDALMERLGPRPYEFAYQSAAISNEPWLGPDASEVMERYAAEGKQHILICPIGFVCEHVEILYDIDVVYQKLAKDLGVQLERIVMLNDSPEMMRGLARLVRETAQEAGWL
ncbi:MAG TPA: ferrochelatase [Anaerolineales bacterium]|nr:ferrochelatase [Anaerolineales bacterium]